MTAVLAEAGRREGRSPRGLLAFHESDLDAFLQRLRQPRDVPVGQPNATVRFALADPRRIVGAVDAVACLRQSDPHRADRIIRACIDGERLCRFDALELVFRIVAVGRIGLDRNDFQRA